MITYKTIFYILIISVLGTSLVYGENNEGDISEFSSMLNDEDLFQIGTQGVEKLRILNNGAVALFGPNDQNSNEGTSLNLLGLSGKTDSSGARHRANINWWSGENGWGDIDNRALAITTHSNGNGDEYNQNHHVTFYSGLKHSSTGVTGKAIQWLWGEDTEGYLELISLNRLRFPEDYTGYYNDETGQIAGIDVDDERFKIALDRNQDGDSEAFAIVSSSGKDIPSFASEELLFYVDKEQTRIGSEYLYFTDGSGPSSSPYISFNGRGYTGFDSEKGAQFIYGGQAKELMLGANDVKDYVMINVEGDIEMNDGNEANGNPAIIFNGRMEFIGYDESLNGMTWNTLSTERNYQWKQNDKVSMLLDKQSNITINSLSGEGNAYACLDLTGKLFRSDNPCN